MRHHRRDPRPRELGIEPGLPPNSCRATPGVRGCGTIAVHRPALSNVTLGLAAPAGPPDRHSCINHARDRKPVIKVGRVWNSRIAEPGLVRGRTARRRTDLSSPAATGCALRARPRSILPEIGDECCANVTDEKGRYRCLNRTAPFPDLWRAATTPSRSPRAAAGGLPPRPRWYSSAGPVGRLADGRATVADSAVGERRRRGRAKSRGSDYALLGGCDQTWLSDHTGAAVEGVRADTSEQLKARSHFGQCENAGRDGRRRSTFRSSGEPRGCATHSTDRAAGRRTTRRRNAHTVGPQPFCEPRPGRGQHVIR